MNSAEHLKELLGTLGVYSLEGSFLGGELESLGDALDQVEERLEEIQREMCLTTARGEGLEKVASLFRRRPVTEDTDQLGQSLAALMRIGGDSFTLAAINNTIAGCGLNAEVSETRTPGTVNVRFPEVSGIPEGFEQMRRIIEDILPAHVRICYLFWYQTWGQMDERNMTWEAVEAEGMTWEYFETMVE